MTENLKAHKAKLEAIPEAAMASKVRSTIIGVFAIVVGIVLRKLFPDLPNWLLIGLIGYGFYSLSGEIMRGFFGFLPAAIRDVRSAIKGVNGATVQPDKPGAAQNVRDETTGSTE